MTDKEFIVQNLDFDQLDKIINIWLDALPNNFKAVIGRSIVNDYVREIISSNNYLKKGIFNSNELVGFVFFGEDDIVIKKLFFKSFLYIIYSFLVDLLSLKVKKLKTYFDVSIFLSLSLIKKKKIDNSSELLIIAIKKENQSKNLGSKLISESLKDEYFNKLDNIIVITLKSELKNIRFYEKNNFKRENEIYGRTYLRLILPK